MELMKWQSGLITVFDLDLGTGIITIIDIFLDSGELKVRRMDLDGLGKLMTDHHRWLNKADWAARNLTALAEVETDK